MTTKQEQAAVTRGTGTKEQEKGEQIQITTLFKFIKPFDGSREKLNSYVTHCDNAISLASDTQKPILFKYILSQLDGKAETACSIKEFDTWEQLREFLKTQFGERKHYTHLLADLQECRQQTIEPVTQFALRVETCLSKLLTEITLSNKKKGELVGRTAAMEDLALHTFLLGLKPNISNLVRGKNPSNLNKAINVAISEEKILNVIFKRNSQSNHASMPQRPVQRPQYTFRPAVNNVNTRFQQPAQSDQNNQHPFCRYCKTPGHTLEVCRKREYNNKRFNVPQTSQFQQRPNAEISRPRPAHVYRVVDDEGPNYYDPETERYYTENNTQHPDDELDHDNHLNE